MTSENPGDTSFCLGTWMDKATNHSGAVTTSLSAIFRATTKTIKGWPVWHKWGVVVSASWEHCHHNGDNDNLQRIQGTGWTWSRSSCMSPTNTTKSTVPGMSTSTWTLMWGGLVKGPSEWNIAKIFPGLGNEVSCIYVFNSLCRHV